MSNERLCSIMGMSKSDYREVENNYTDLPITALFNLSSEIKIDVESIVSGTVDLDLLLKRHKGDSSSISSKYLKNVDVIGGRMSTVKNIFNYLAVINPKLCDKILLKYQLTKNAFNANHFVSADLAKDIYNDLVANSIRKDLLTYLAKLNIFMNKNCSSITTGSGPREVEGPTDIFKSILDNVNSFDRIWTHNFIELKDDYCRYRSKTRERVSDLLSIHDYGSHEMCIHRTGFAMGIVEEFGFSLESMNEISCVHLGDSHCETIVKFKQ